MLLILQILGEKSFRPESSFTGKMSGLDLIQMTGSYSTMK